MGSSSMAVENNYSKCSFFTLDESIACWTVRSKQSCSI